MDRKREINILVGANIKREREKAGYTQDRLSELLGIGPKSLSAIERGVVGVSLTTLLAVCRVLDLSPNVLLLEQSRKNDTAGMLEQLETLSPEQFAIAREVLNNLLKAFAPAQK